MSFREVVAEHNDDTDDDNGPPDDGAQPPTASGQPSPFSMDYQFDSWAIDAEKGVQLASVVNTAANLAALL